MLQRCLNAFSAAAAAAAHKPGRLASACNGGNQGLCQPMGDCMSKGEHLAGDQVADVCKLL